MVFQNQIFLKQQNFRVFDYVLLDHGVIIRKLSADKLKYLQRADFYEFGNWKNIPTGSALFLKNDLNIKIYHERT